MDDHQTSIVEHYLSLLEDPKSDVEQILQSAAEDSQLFVFSEILHHPRVGSLNSVWTVILRTLAFKRFKDLLSLQVPLVRENEAILTKMRKLTVLTIVVEYGWQQIPLTVLQSELEIDSPISLFKLLLEMQRAKMFDVRIDERNGWVNVINMFVHRDVDANILSDMREKVFEYLKHVDKIISDPASVLTEEQRLALALCKLKFEKKH
jgi:hypothetical protein